MSKDALTSNVLIYSELGLQYRDEERRRAAFEESNRQGETSQLSNSSQILPPLKSQVSFKISDSAINQMTNRSQYSSPNRYRSRGTSLTSDESYSPPYNLRVYNAGELKVNHPYLSRKADRLAIKIIRSTKGRSISLFDTSKQIGQSEIDLNSQCDCLDENTYNPLIQMDDREGISKLLNAENKLARLVDAQNQNEKNYSNQMKKIKNRIQEQNDRLEGSCEQSKNISENLKGAEGLIEARFRTTNYIKRKQDRMDLYIRDRLEKLRQNVYIPKLPKKYEILEQVQTERYKRQIISSQSKTVPNSYSSSPSKILH